MVPCSLSCFTSLAMEKEEVKETGGVLFTKRKSNRYPFS